MKYPWLYVGARVVYVAGGHVGTAPCPHRLLRGETYTVRGFYESISGRLGLWLEERPPVKFYRGVEIGWAADNFRPVLPDTSKQIEAMRNLMLDAKTRGKVNA